MAIQYEITRSGPVLSPLFEMEFTLARIVHIGGSLKRE